MTIGLGQSVTLTVAMKNGQLLLQQLGSRAILECQIPGRALRHTLSVIGRVRRRQAGRGKAARARTAS